MAKKKKTSTVNRFFKKKVVEKDIIPKEETIETTLESVINKDELALEKEIILEKELEDNIVEKKPEPRTLESLSTTELRVFQRTGQMPK